MLFPMTNELTLLRRKHALTQTELANLIGVSQTSIGRLEAGDDDTTHHLRLKTAFGLQVVFGRKPERLFQDLFAKTEDAIMRQAAALDRALDGRPDRASEHKRLLLADMARRASNRPITP